MQLLAFVLASVCCSAYASSSWNIRDYPYPDHRDIHRRSIVSDGSSLKSSYDFIIVGGGTAGLVLASRLSEDSNTTVLVLEAGDTGDAVADQIDIPSDTYYDGLAGSSYDWQYSTTKQSSLSDRTVSWPRGKVLGGSSAINGLYAVRPSKLEYDTLADLQEGADGASAWNWDNQFNELKTVETFTAPDSTEASSAGLQYSTDSHGSDGPLHVSWPGFMLPVVGNWTETLANVGVRTNTDPYSGDNGGAFIALSSMNPSNWTRSYSRTAYIDPLPPRSNLDILPLATVTKINFDTSDSSNVTATGVTYQTSSTSSGTTINANKEVIMAAGSIGTPQVLMLSGIGPSDVLSAVGISSIVNLPGVGQHLSDHLSVGINWKTNTETSASLRDAGTTDAEVLGWVNEAEAYVNISTLFGTDADTQQQTVLGELDSSASSLVPSSDDTVVAGYKAIYNATAEVYMPSDLGHVELLFSAQGQKGSTDQSITIQCALQHPFSTGRIYLSSTDAFTAPSIDPQYLSHTFDVSALVQCLKFARTVGGTAPLNQYLTEETYPGSSVSTDSDWESFVKSNTYTEYHPGGSCSMLPLSKGGCVDPKLLVYGTKNLRIIDASIFPMQFASHLQMSVYALGETGAKIIKAQYDGTTAPGEASATSTDSSSQSSQTSSASSVNVGSSLGLIALMAVGAFLA